MNDNFFKSIFKKLTLKFIILVFFLLLLISTYADLPETTIGSWNLKNFGLGRSRIIPISDVIFEESPDILFLQEIKAKGKGVKAIVDRLRVRGLNYNYAITRQVEKTPGNAEGYAVLFKEHITLEGLPPREHIIKRADEIQKINAAGETAPMIGQGHNYDSNQMVRPPMECNFLINEERLIAYNSHITFYKEKVNDPPENNEIQKEIEIQEAAILKYHNPQEKNVLLAGDYNAGGELLRGGLKCAAKGRDIMPIASWYDSIPYENDTAVVCSKNRTRSERLWKPYDHMFFSKFMEDKYNFDYKIIGPPPPEGEEEPPTLFHGTDHRFIVVKITPHPELVEER